jgi:hypothetical protein
MISNQQPCEDNGTTAGANKNPSFTNAVCTNPQSPALDFHVGGTSLGGFDYTGFTNAGTYNAGTTSTPVQAPGGNSADVTNSFPTNVPSNACTAF